MTCAAAALLLACLGFVPSAHADEGAKLPPEITARVNYYEGYDEKAKQPTGRLVRSLPLSFDGFCLAAYQQLAPELRLPGSAPTTVLRRLIEHRVTELEAQRLGVTVTQADIDQSWKEQSDRIRRSTNGMKDLDTLLRENDRDPQNARRQLGRILLRTRVAGHDAHLGKLPKDERRLIAQVSIVIGELVKKSVVRYGIEVAPALLNGGRPMRLPNPSWICTIQIPGTAATQAQPITQQELGREFVLQLSTGTVRGILDRECKTALMISPRWQLTDRQFDLEVAHQRKIWAVERTLASQEALKELTYDQYVEHKYKKRIVDMRQDRYYRSFFGMLSKLREEITDQEVVKEYEKRRESVWGEYILVWDVQIEFAQDARGSFADRTQRPKMEAVRLAKEIGRLQASGLPWDQIVQRVNGRQDPTFKAVRRRLRSAEEKSMSAQDHVLFKTADAMRDGQVSRAIETLTALHILRREQKMPPPSFDKVRILIKEVLARRKATLWLQERLENDKIVQVQWPIPQRGRMTKKSGGGNLAARRPGGGGFLPGADEDDR